MVPLESSIEAYLVKRVKAAGGKVMKISGAAHWPDRLVLLPIVNPLLVELKRPRNGRLSEGQVELHKRLADIGHDVHVLWTKEDVDRFMIHYRW